jgi:hypothetical protein
LDALDHVCIVLVIPFLSHLTGPSQFVHTLAGEADGMAENEAQTMTVPVATQMSATQVPSEGTPAPTPGTLAPAEGALFPVASAPLPVEGTPVPVGGTPVLVEATAVPVEGTAGSAEGRPPRNLMSRLRTPAAAAVGGGLLLFGIGFGSGFVVGHSWGGSSSNTVPTVGPGGFTRGGGGFGPGRQGQGQGQPGGPGFGQQIPGGPGGVQQAPGGGTGSTGGTGTTAFTQSQ